MAMKTPTPQCVGREFVQQYYTLLNKAPLYLHKFYKQDSVFLHGGLDRPGQETQPAVGEQDIQEQVMQLNFRNCHTKIRQIDSQETLENGLVVQVSGEFSNNGQPMQPFIQMYVLDKVSVSPIKYYIRNDIFRFQDEKVTGDEEVSETKQNWKPIPVEADMLLSKEFENFGGIDELTDYTIITAKELQKGKKRKKNKSKGKGVVMETSTPQCMGQKFIKQYYALLNKTPLRLCRFYNHDSVFLHGGLNHMGQETQPAVGQQDIQEQIMQLNFRDCHIKVRQIDIQKTLGNGVVMQVSGKFSNNDQPMRPFMQTFILVGQSPEKCYIRNDIFHFQDEKYTEDENVLKTKQNWKPVPVEADKLLLKEFVSFGSIDELTDDKIITAKEEKKEKKRKKKNKLKENKKVKTGSSDESNEVPSLKEPNNTDMSAWSNFFLPSPVLQALEDLKYQHPTKIQELCIPVAFTYHKDVLGAAETGSGKTLAFGIPIVSHILSIKERTKNDDGTKPLYSLILTPTRELACQIKSHLQAICKYTDIMVSIVVGGMAAEKQRRILKKCPDIVVATPGRLWELIEEGEPHLNQITSIKHLVIDEADRMLEKGHFAELTQILNLINSNQNNKRQNLIFSATLTLVHDTPKRLNFKKNKAKLQQKFKLDSLMNTIGMRKHYEVIDITKKTGVVETLTESQIMCSLEDKDTYLYYFITVYPGRTIVFCNSIDCVRRLRTVLEYLNCNPLPLHASMHQRQRLKNLEKFASSENAVLLATDVAARGLDIRGIEHVIHFQVPRTAETYVHRSGRTARAQNEGLSLMFIDPQEGAFYKRICKTLNKDKALPSFPIDSNILKEVEKRVTLVRAIDKLEHRITRLNAQNRWFVNTAKEMDVDIEEEDLLNDMGSEHECALKGREIKSMKKKLKAMLAKPIMPKSLIGSYPTKSGKLLRPPVLRSEKAIHVVKKRRLQG